MLQDMAAGFIFNDGKILLVKNDKHGSSRYEPPGGKKEDNESYENKVFELQKSSIFVSFEECAVREIKEEIGIDIEIERLFGIYKTDSPEGEFAVHTYLCRIKDGSPKPLVHNFGWYTFDDLLRLRGSGTLVPNMCLALEDIKDMLQ